MDRAEAMKYIESLLPYAKSGKEYESLYAALVAMQEQARSKWISVGERLPEEHKTVLILCKNGAMFTGYQSLDYNDDVRWRIHTALNSTKLLNKGRVTHWLYLPELLKIKPPKIGASEESKTL